MDAQFDLLVIGGGVVGCAIAREMTRTGWKIGLLEKHLDVGREASGRNSAVLHGGFAYDPGTLKAKLCVEGNAEFDQVAEELGVPFKRTGKVLVGSSPEDLASLRRTLETGRINGARELCLIDSRRLHELVPAVVGEFALYSPTSGIMDPFLYTVALAENAVRNGAQFFLGAEVTGIVRDGGIWRLKTPRGEFTSRWVVNSAGLGCGRINKMLGLPGCRILGSKGDYIILDKRVGPLLPMPVYPVPSNTYMGIHVTPTVDGNVTVGPNAEYVQDFDYYGVPQQSIDSLAESANRLWPCIHRQDYIRNYSGILSKWVDEDGTIHDFTIEARPEAPNTVSLIGIESPGLTAALPIARYVSGLIRERENPGVNPGFDPRREPIVRFAGADDETRAALIAADPDYGELVCRCEQVTRAELLQAIHNPLGAHTLTAIKYRTRCMMGRCQGGYCQMRLAQMLEQELGLLPNEVLYERPGSQLFTGRVRGE